MCIGNVSCKDSHTAASDMLTLWEKISQQKQAAEPSCKDIPLHRCLTTFDLTLMGVGAMVGSGIYVMTGIAAKEYAGW